MGRLRHLLLYVLASLGVIGVISGIAYAATITQTVQGTTDKTIYQTGRDITINGTVNGDIFCAGQSITINAVVNGDVICAGQTITLNGIINGSVRVVGQNINIGATISHAASVAGQDVNVENSGSVSQDLSSVSQNLTIEGSIGRDLTGASNQLVINNSIGRNVNVRASELDLQGNAKVSGNIDYTSPMQLSKDPGASILGTVSFHKQVPHRHRGFTGMFFFKLYWMLAMVIIGVVLVALFPQMFIKMTPKYGAGFWWSLLFGFMAMFIIPLSILLLILTVIGAPFGILLLLFALIGSILTIPAATYFIGKLIVPKFHPILIVLIGSVVLGIVEMLPVIGWIVGLLSFWLGAGILLRGFKKAFVKPNYSTKHS